MTWRKEKRTLEESGVMNEFNELWRREITKYANDLKETAAKKIQFLRTKYKRTHTQVPDELHRIVLQDQELGNEYTSSPRKYGDITLNDDEEALLSLPPKFAIHRKVDE